MLSHCGYFLNIYSLLDFGIEDRIETEMTLLIETNWNDSLHDSNSADYINLETATIKAVCIRATKLVIYYVLISNSILRTYVFN